MRISVLADESGNIIGTLRPAEAQENGPTRVHMRPRHGQQVHEVVLPEELAHLRSLASLHDTHRVVCTGSGAQLVARK